MDPNFGLAHLHIGISYALKERYEEAISAFQNATKLMGRSPRLISSLGSAYAMSGEKDKAEELLHKLKEHLKEGYVPQTCIANIYIGLGENDKAFEWFEKAYEERDPLMAFLKTWPEFENLRSDPRFNELLKKMGFL
jgi:tetratricopeptide (TPR) repeat protein